LLWLWIPGSALAGCPGMTAQLICPTPAHHFAKSPRFGPAAVTIRGLDGARAGVTHACAGPHETKLNVANIAVSNPPPCRCRSSAPRRLIRRGRDRARVLLWRPRWRHDLRTPDQAHRKRRDRQPSRSFDSVPRQRPRPVRARPDHRCLAVSGARARHDAGGCHSGLGAIRERMVSGEWRIGKLPARYSPVAIRPLRLINEPLRHSFDCARLRVRDLKILAV
jgi:hypothetical protein